MPRASQQKLKIMYIMKALLENTDEEHGLSVAQITEMLERNGITAERKSIYDDIEELRRFGMDIELRRGKSSTYHVMSREFQLPELKLLVDSVQASKFITEKKSRELIGKLEGLTSRYQARRLNRQVMIAGRIKTENESIYYVVDLIHEAINRDVKISFKYMDWTPQKKKEPRHGGKVYTVSPWGLTLSEQKYYLIAYDDSYGTVRHYRVDKIFSPVFTEEKRGGVELFKDFDIAQYTNRNFEMYKGEEITVELRCKNELAGVIIDRFGENVPFSNLTESAFDAHVKVYASPIFYGWLANFGDGITVVSPESVRTGYVSHLRGILDTYGE